MAQKKHATPNVNTRDFLFNLVTPFQLKSFELIVQKTAHIAQKIFKTKQSFLCIPAQTGWTINKQYPLILAEAHSRCPINSPILTQ